MGLPQKGLEKWLRKFSWNSDSMRNDLAWLKFAALAEGARLATGEL
jgi:hypothetical protein